MIALIAAVAQNNVIGSKNDLPWYLPEDLKHFKELTTGHTVLMGRKTYESIIKRLGKPLPNRKSVVISHQKDYNVPAGVESFSSVADAFAAHQQEDIFVIGGGEIFNQTFNLADTLYITHVHKNYPGDVYFPPIDTNIWQKVSEELHEGFAFAKYEKQPQSNKG